MHCSGTMVIVFLCLRKLEVGGTLTALYILNTLRMVEFYICMSVSPQKIIYWCISASLFSKFYGCVWVCVCVDELHSCCIVGWWLLTFKVESFLLVLCVSLYLSNLTTLIILCNLRCDQSSLCGLCASFDVYTFIHTGESSSCMGF